MGIFLICHKYYTVKYVCYRKAYIDTSFMQILHISQAYHLKLNKNSDVQSVSFCIIVQW